jgi:acyl-CoA synthetase (AMP-forming)/AMP-acid ligase II
VSDTGTVAPAGVTARPSTFGVGSVLAATVGSAPDRPAVIDAGRTVTYAALDLDAERVAAALGRDGVGPGQRIAFLADDVIACLTVLIGAARSGAVAVPVNGRLAPGEIGGILADSGATTLVTTSDAARRLAAEGAMPGVGRVVILDGCASAADASGDGSVTWADWLAGTCDGAAAPGGIAAGAATAGAAAGVPPDRTGVVLQMYTSGTTGRPKGVLLTDDNLTASVPEICGLWGLDATSRMLAVLPLFHIAGLGSAVGTLWSGATLVVARAPAADAIVDDIEAHGITNVVLVSVLLQRMIEEADARLAAGRPADLSTLRVVGYGAAPISQQVLHDALRLLPCGLLQVYGLTESAGTICVLRPDDHDPAAPDRLRSCGRPLDSLELRLIDPTTDTAVATGDVGEIQIRSARVTQGYWQAPAATSEAITPDGWLRTGDLAWADDDGFVYLCDRLRDMIVTGGENVYPAEVEDVLGWHPAVAEAAVVGVPDDRWGETPRAVVVAAPGATVDETELIAFVRDHLAHFKCPTGVDFAADLPRNATGKVLRRVLREPYWSGHGRLVN